MLYGSFVTPKNCSVYKQNFTYTIGVTGIIKRGFKFLDFSELFHDFPLS